MIDIMPVQEISGLYVFTPKVYADNRGYFMESFNIKDFNNLPLNIDFVQDNESKSQKGTLRGLHFQHFFPQDKLIRVINGGIFDVAVDIRAGSPTYGKYYSVLLSAENKKQFYIPKGFAHGFLALEDNTIIQYKCTDFYHPEDEDGIIWNDPRLNIDWPDLDTQYIFSEKDLNRKNFSNQKILVDFF